MKVKISDSYIDIPEEVLTSIQTVEEFFKERNIKKWRCSGIASIEYVTDVEETIKSLENTILKNEDRLHNLLERFNKLLDEQK